MDGLRVLVTVAAWTAFALVVFPRVHALLDALPPQVSLPMLLGSFAALLLCAWYFHDRPEAMRREMAVRAREGKCPHCGYDATGNVSGVCPECGRRLPWLKLNL